MLTVALASIVLALLIIVIGGGLAFVIGLRGLWLVGTAAPFTFSVIAIASTIAPIIGMRWSLLPVALVAILLAAGILLVRRAMRRPLVWRTARPASGLVWAAVALVFAAVLIGWRVLAAFGGPEAISQTFDNVFHLNAIRYILESGSASSLDVGGLTGAMSFYPAVWHAAAALLVQLTGATIPVAVQALTLVISALVWPAGALALTGALFGATRGVLLSTGVVVAAIPAFPLLMMDYGVLYPYQLSLALLPSLLAVTLAVVRTPAPDGLALGWWLFAMVGCLPGLVLAHPGGFIGWLALSVPMFAFLFLRLWRSAGSGRTRTLLVVSAVGYLIVGGILLKVLRPAAEARGWPTALSPLGAVWQVFSVSMFIGVSSVVVAVGVIFGIVRLVRERTADLWIATGMWAIGAGLFVVVSGLAIGPLRDALTGGWYNNWPRLAALFAVALVPLAAVGLAGAASLCARLLPETLAPRAVAAIAVVAAAAVALIAQFPAMPAAQAAAHSNYVMTSDSRLLSPDELALLERLPAEVPEDAVIAGNPYTGTGLAFAFTGRRVLMPHMLMYLTKEGHVVNDGLDDAESDPGVCAAVTDLGITHVLDFGDREVHGESHVYPGLDDLAESAAVELVDEQGDARLYRITACGLG